MRARIMGIALTVASVATLTGCEVNGLLDPSITGRWQRTPIILPILSHLDVIDERPADPPGLRPVIPEDLIPEDTEYAIDSGDLITVSIFELMAPNVETVQTRRVDEVGQIRLPVLGRIEVGGYTASAFEERLVRMLEERGILRDPTVSVIVQENRSKTFSVLGGERFGRNVGIYQILRNDFRLMDALALSGATTQARTIHVIRRIDISLDEDEPITTQTSPETPPDEAEGDPEPADLIEELLQGLEPEPLPEEAPQGKEPPEVLESGLDRSTAAPRWVNVGGTWKRVEGDSAAAPSMEDADVKQVVIEVPIQRLLEGDMAYNIVIRPGDIVRLPPPIGGNVYLGGAVARPGTYAVPGEKELTLRQLIFSAGGFSQVAHPERVDLIRRMENDTEAIVRLDLRGIFEGTQPDFYLKPDDTVNVGTSLAAALLAIGRNGLRISYGFGFVFDRNFSNTNNDDD